MIRTLFKRNIILYKNMNFINIFIINIKINYSPQIINHIKILFHFNK